MDKTKKKLLNDLINEAVIILRKYGATQIYVFGSANSEEFDFNSSDLDLAVRGIQPSNFYSAVGEIMCSIKRNVDVVDLDAETAFGTYLVEHGELARVA